MIAVAIPDRWDGHQLVLASAREGGDALAGWVERGLRLQEKMLYAAYGDHTSVDELVASLDAHGVDASAAAEDGRLEVVEPARLYRADGYTGLVDQARREGYSGVRTFVGPDAAAGAVDAADLEEFERVADRLWAARGVTSFCRYDPRLAAGRDRLVDIIATHASGWGDQMVHVYRGDAGELCLEGEVDLANDAVFAAIMSVAAAKAERQLVVDCSALRFMSVSAWRTAVNATAPLRERGGRVLLSGVSPLEHHILNTTGFGEAFDEVSV